jgi:hypothetical protein
VYFKDARDPTCWTVYERETGDVENPDKKLLEVQIPEHLRDPPESSDIEAYFPSDSDHYEIPVEEFAKEFKTEKKVEKQKQKEMEDALPS